MAKFKILIAEDDPAIRELVALHLDGSKYVVVFAGDGEEALLQFNVEKPDLMLLDIQMPKMSGLEVCQHIRGCSLIPIIFVSSRGDDQDIIAGLELGADDYVTKPFNMKVLLARIEANLRYPNRDLDDTEIIRNGELEFDYKKHEVRKLGKKIDLHPRELLLLLYLAKHPNQVIRPSHLYEEVWGADSLGDTLTVSVHVSRIRKKIEDDPKRPEYIQTVKGQGYIFVS